MHLKQRYLNGILVETGEYINYSWGTECFRLTLKRCSHKLTKDPSSFKFSGFHLALQIWFYECWQYSCYPCCKCHTSYFQLEDIGGIYFLRLLKEHHFQNIWQPGLNFNSKTHLTIFLIVFLFKIFNPAFLFCNYSINLKT